MAFLPHMAKLGGLVRCYTVRRAQRRFPVVLGGWRGLVLEVESVWVVVVSILAWH